MRYKEMGNNNLDYIVARHEVGHLLALIASGIYNEFTCMEVVGDGIANGYTRRSGSSLIDYVNEITKAATIGKIMDFIADKEIQLKYVLPHICYFLGGGAIDSRYGCESDDRNRIDHQELMDKVLPSIFVQASKQADGGLSCTSKADLDFLKTNVYQFMFKAISEYESLAGLLTVALQEKKSLTKADTDRIIGEWKRTHEVDNLVGAYAELQAKVAEWLRKRSYLAA